MFSIKGRSFLIPFKVFLFSFVISISPGNFSSITFYYFSDKLLSPEESPRWTQTAGTLKKFSDLSKRELEDLTHRKWPISPRQAS